MALWLVSRYLKVSIESLFYEDEDLVDSVLGDVPVEDPASNPAVVFNHLSLYIIVSYLLL